MMVDNSLVRKLKTANLYYVVSHYSKVYRAVCEKVPSAYRARRPWDMKAWCELGYRNGIGERPE